MRATRPSSLRRTSFLNGCFERASRLAPCASVYARRWHRRGQARSASRHRWGRPERVARCQKTGAGLPAVGQWAESGCPPNECFRRPRSTCRLMIAPSAEKHRLAHGKRIGWRSGVPADRRRRIPWARSVATSAARVQTAVGSLADGSGGIFPFAAAWRVGVESMPPTSDNLRESGFTLTEKAKPYAVWRRTANLVFRNGRSTSVPVA